jgi:uncharacterized membrane protein YphA (DoxX/SURF4 family)
MAGIYKVFELGPVGHAERFFLPYRDTFLPAWSLWATGTSIPFIELVAGALVIVGWRIREALVALGAVLILVTFGHLLKQPLYAFHEHIIPRLALVLFILVLPRDADRFAVDFWLRSRSRNSGQPDTRASGGHLPTSEASLRTALFRRLRKIVACQDRPRSSELTRAHP